MTPEELEVLTTAIRNGIYGDDRMPPQTRDAALAALDTLISMVEEIEPALDQAEMLNRECLQLRAKLDAAEGRRAPGEGWRLHWRSLFERAWVKALPDGGTVEVPCTLPCVLSASPGKSRYVIESPLSIYNGILAADAWIKRNYP